MRLIGKILNLKMYLIFTIRCSFINNSLIYHIVEITCGRDKLIEHYFQTEGKIERPSISIRSFRVKLSPGVSLIIFHKIHAES